MMNCEWKPSVETVLHCISTFSGVNLSGVIIISNTCSHGYHRDTERKRDFLCLLSLDRGSGLETRKTPTITEFQILSQTISSSQFLQHSLPVIGRKRRDSWWLWCREGAAAAKNFIISMEFWVLVQDGGGRAGARKNATELMGGLAVLLVQKRACLKLGRKRGRINKKWMTIHLLL